MPQCEEGKTFTEEESLSVFRKTVIGKEARSQTTQRTPLT